MLKRHWNIFLLCFVIAIVCIIVYIKRDDLGLFVQTIKSVQLMPFILASCCLFGRYLSHAYAYRAVFNCVNEEVPYFHVIPLVFSVTFANDMAPTVGMAGSALIAAWSHKQGLDMGKSVSIVFLEKIGYFGGFAIVMLVGIIILLGTGQMSLTLALGGLAVFAIIFVFAFVLYLAYGHIGTARRLFVWAERWIDRVRRLMKKDPMEPWADRITASFHSAAILAMRKPRQLVIMFLRMVMLHVFDCCCFICVGYAFGFTHPTLLIASYVAGFIIATFIPQTIGAVEILLALVIGAYGANAGQAAAIALIYRGLIFWVPFLIGAVCINITGNAKSLNTQVDREIIAEGIDVNVGELVHDTVHVGNGTKDAQRDA